MFLLLSVSTYLSLSLPRTLEHPRPVKKVRSRSTHMRQVVTCEIIVHRKHPINHILYSVCVIERLNCQMISVHTKWVQSSAADSNPTVYRVRVCVRSVFFCRIWRNTVAPCTCTRTEPMSGRFISFLFSSVIWYDTDVVVVFALPERRFD